MRNSRYPFLLFPNTRNIISTVFLELSNTNHIMFFIQIKSVYNMKSPRLQSHVFMSWSLISKVSLCTLFCSYVSCRFTLKKYSHCHFCNWQTIKCFTYIVLYLNASFLNVPALMKICLLTTPVPCTPFKYWLILFQRSSTIHFFVYNPKFSITNKCSLWHTSHCLQHLLFSLFIYYFVDS